MYQQITQLERTERVELSYEFELLLLKLNKLNEATSTASTNEIGEFNL